MSEDKLYSWLNPRGRKSFKAVGRAQLVEKFPEYAKIGLPAHKAALEGNVEALREIYAAYTAEGVPSRDVNGATPLHLAVRGNRIEAVKWLLRFTDLSPTISAKHGETPCHVAAALGHTECLKAMVAADVKGDICVVADNSGFTPLHLAIVKSRNEVAKLLISDLGARGVGAVSDTGITAAHVAASSGNVEVLKIIASKHKKFLSQETADGTTPLYFAAQEGRLPAVKYLYEKGKCDLAHPSSDGRRPIHAACQCGHTHIMKYIVSQMTNYVIFDTVPDGATTLHFAASTGQVDTAKWLIDSDVGGKLITSKDNNGDTPAHDAADNGKLETLTLLLESGADLYAVNSDGNTPYSLALSSQEPGLADYVMAFASNAPQKQEEGPSQMTIFDMQGEVDVVDLPSKERVTVEAEVEVMTEERGETERESPEAPSTPGKKGDQKKEDKKSKKEKKEKEKKEKKQKDKKGKKNGSSNSFLHSAGAALLAIPPEDTSGSGTGLEKTSSDHKVLAMTEEELDMFKEEPNATDDTAKLHAASSDDGEIVVSYEEQRPTAKTKGSQLSHPEPITSQQYMTVSEMEKAEKKKSKKKMGRKNSKSIQKQKHEEESAKNVEEAGAILSGSQMGFKPQFRTNPLQKLGGVAPPTPPPTPATGFSSSAASDAGMVSTEDEDDMPYDMYTHEMESKRVSATPVDDKTSSEEKEEESESVRPISSVASKTQENVVTNLDDEEEEEDDDEEEDKKPVLKKWPPPKVVDYKPAEAKLEPSGVNVLAKWQPATTAQSDPKPASPTSPGSGSVLKKWPPAAASNEPKSSNKEPQPLKKAPSPLTSPPVTLPPSPPLTQHTDVDKEERAPVKLGKIESAGDTMNAEGEKKDTELGRVKLKKATRTGANYSSPSSEATSGADNELSTLLKIRQKRV